MLAEILKANQEDNDNRIYSETKRKVKGNLNNLLSPLKKDE